MDMQSLIDEMVALLQKIKAGTATLGELETFAAAASQLNERAIILKYKAYEAKVYQQPFEMAEAHTPAAAAVQASAASESFSAPVVETPTPEGATEDDDMSFDLFSLEDNESEIEMETEEPVTPDSPLATFEQENTEFNVSDHAPEETPFFEQEVSPIHATPMAAPSTEDALSNAHGQHPIYARLVVDDNSLAARLLNVPLASLHGAFGFNERLQIIQELFDGNADAYNDAIQVLDQQPNKAHARAVASGFAYQFGWDENSNTALDFIQKVERRYA